MELPLTFGSFTLEETKDLRRGYESRSGLLKPMSWVRIAPGHAKSSARTAAAPAPSR
ncbi:unnamed protein product, partial [Ascophyllum nodosum]